MTLLALDDKSLKESALGERRTSHTERVSKCSPYALGLGNKFSFNVF